MRVLSLMTLVGGVAVAAISSFMAITNPGQNDYEEYATEELSLYLKGYVCNQSAHQLGGLLQSYCKTVVDVGRPKIQQIIAHTTKRHNYLLFSIYQTELSLPSPVPTYQFETIGVLQKFYTYQAEALSNIEPL